MLTAPAQAAPEADEPVGTVRLATEKRVTVDYPWAGGVRLPVPAGDQCGHHGRLPDAVRPPTPARTTRAAVRPAWGGTPDNGGGTTGSGPCPWELTAHPRDGQGPDLTVSGAPNPG
ncbi:hypothetical protein [Streptomyces hawaiiensis]|uniref:hypothetical protein n=1 Tax=Streptomyces hawaiiensis TaxID=67305 RepID=UPI003654A393